MILAEESENAVVVRLSSERKFQSRHLDQVDGRTTELQSNDIGRVLFDTKKKRRGAKCKF